MSLTRAVGNIRGTFLRACYGRLVSQTLDDLRRLLDAIDHRLIAALSERRQVVGEVARLKADSPSTAVRDARREQEIVDRARVLGQESGLDPDHIEKIFREVLEHSVRLQREYLAARSAAASAGSYAVGYQGGEGAFSYIAAQRHFKGRGEASYIGYPSFPSMLDALKVGEVRYAVLPVENSIAGSISESYDLLAKTGFHLVGEEIQPVEHCLIALSDLPVSSIRRIISHPVALAQCQNFLGSLENCHVESYLDTALAVAKVKADEDPGQAAIASEEAARLHGLPVIARGIADVRENFTRMVVVARDPVAVEAGVPAKTSLLLSLAHKPGALASAISALSSRGLNLTKIESRPVVGAPFEYTFYIDFEGNSADSNVACGVDDLRAHTRSLRVLGCYPSATRDS